MYIYTHIHIYQANFENCVLDLEEGLRVESAGDIGQID